MKSNAKAVYAVAAILLAVVLAPRVFAAGIEGLRSGADLGFGQVISDAKVFRAAASRAAVPAAEPSLAAASTGVIDDRVENAKFLLDELHRTNKAGYSEELIGRLTTLARSAPYSEALTQMIVAGLFADLHRADNVAYDLAVVETLGKIALASPYPVQEAVLRGIMTDITRVNDFGYSLQVLDVFTHVASKSRSEDIKETAVSLLEAEITRVDRTFYSKRLLSMVDKVRASRAS